MNHPTLKSVSAVAAGDRVLVYVRPFERVELADPDGSTAALLRLLAEGSRDVYGLTAALAELGHVVPQTDVAEAVDALAGLGIVHEADDWSDLPPAVRGRHESNLRWYELFSSPSRSAADVHDAVARGRVLLLGAGGAGSGILQSLVGAGVGFVRLVDLDRVEPKNLARQFLYGQAAVGRPKVEAAADWVHAYSTDTEIEPIVERVADADRIRELAADVDVVVCAIDTPTDAQLLVNRACLELGVPFVTGGLQQSTLYYWSVEPGVSACRQCLELHRQDQLRGAESALAGPPLLLASPVNRGTGPVVQILAGQMALETLRFLARHDEPVARATYHWIGLADGMEVGRDPWTTHPDCPLCAARRTQPVRSLAAVPA